LNQNPKQVDTYLQYLDKQIIAELRVLNKSILEQLSELSLDTPMSEVNEIVERAFESAGYTAAVSDIVAKNTLKAAEFALGDNLGVASVDNYIKRMFDKTYSGVTLSKIIRDNTKEAEKLVSHTVKTQIKNGTTWKNLSAEIRKVDKVSDVASVITDLSAAAKRLDLPRATQSEIAKLTRDAQRYVKRLSPGGAPTKELKRAYEGIIKAVESRSPEAVSRAIEKAAQAKINYNADRIARTEMSQAYSEAFMARIEQDDAITGFRWSLSSRHPVPDECDFYAEFNGGVYQKGEFPALPAHPMCLCTLTAYYGDTPPKTSNASAVRFLDKQPEAKRKAMIGKDAEYKSKYIDGLRKHGIVIESTAAKLPQEFITTKGVDK